MCSLYQFHLFVSKIKSQNKANKLWIHSMFFTFFRYIFLSDYFTHFVYNSLDFDCKKKKIWKDRSTIEWSTFRSNIVHMWYVSLKLVRQMLQTVQTVPSLAIHDNELFLIEMLCVFRFNFIAWVFTWFTLSIGHAKKRNNSIPDWFIDHISKSNPSTH